MDIKITDALSDNKINHRRPILTVRYKNHLYKFFNKIDYNNWVKSISDKENISDHKFYKEKID